MKKKAVFTALILFVSLFHFSHAYGYTLPAKVRVGFQGQYREVDSITLENRTLLVGFGTSGYQSDAITRNTRFSITVSGQVYIRVPQEASGYAHARGVADTYATQGHAAVPALVDDGRWTIYLGGYASQAEAQVAAYAVSGTVIPANSRQVLLTDGSNAAVVFDSSAYFPQLADGENGYMTLGDKKYRGVIEIGRYAGKKLTAVNVLSLEEYLYSTVSSEMPSTWSAEALKAQAVASRSYSVTRMGVHASEGYDLCDASHCQNYKGVTNEAAASNQAVLETSGVVAYYDDQPINAVFFSSSGGVTEDSEHVWANSVPYLRSVPDPNEYEAKQWVRSFTLAELTELLRKNNINIGTAVQVTAGYGGSGRVTALSIQGTQGSKVLNKEEIRTFFSPSVGGSLESRNFTLTNGAVQTTGSQVYVAGGGAASAYDIRGLYGLTAEGSSQALQNFTAKGSTGTAQLSSGISSVSSEGDSVTFIGKGWGHGVGMSQRGAEGLARSGYTYRQILTHYYTGITVY